MHETVRFALDGDDYEVELRREEADRLRRLLAFFIARARPIGLPGRELRRWALARGLPVSHRGRVPAEIRQAYLASRADVEIRRAYLDGRSG